MHCVTFPSMFRIGWCIVGMILAALTLVWILWLDVDDAWAWRMWWIECNFRLISLEDVTLLVVWTAEYEYTASGSNNDSNAKAATKWALIVMVRLVKIDALPGCLHRCVILYLSKPLFENKLYQVQHKYNDHVAVRSNIARILNTRKVLRKN